MILGTAPVEGRIAGIVDIPNVCATLAIPTAIFDFDINPNALGPKKQTTRMLKCVCSECGYVARTTAKWLETVGAPLCACNSEQMEVA